MDYITTMPRTDQERAGKIRTFTGRYVNPLSMRPEDLDIRDIAHHLSNECRYAGACPQFYSVAQHCVLASRYFITPQMKLAGLLHDSAEAYLKDLPSPIKHDPRMAFYRELDHELTQMIFERFGIGKELLAATKTADDAMFKREVDSWWGNALDIIPWEPQMACRKFLYCFKAYSAQLEEGIRTS